MTQWLGGMGIIVLFVAILPKFSVAGRQMFFAENPNPSEEKITPRVRHTASWLWGIYLGLTILQVAILNLQGLIFIIVSVPHFQPLVQADFHQILTVSWVIIAIWLQLLL